MRRAAVLGHPISHSLSPVLHRAAYAELGLDWSYEAIDVTSEQLSDFLAGLDSSWVGLSLTMPLKQTVLSFLVESSATVAAAGGANTVLVTEAGLIGDNTDVYGIVAALRERRDFRPPRTFGIIGAGATAAAAMVAAAELAVDRVVVSARRTAPAEDLADRGRALGLQVETVPWEQVEQALACDAIVVTLPGDAAANLISAIPAEPGVLLDVTYHPWPTSLAMAWEQRSGSVIPGHQMLLWQAVRQVELMTGRPAPVTSMAAAMREALSGQDPAQRGGNG